jgi:hypothetical protein
MNSERGWGIPMPKLFTDATFGKKFLGQREREREREREGERERERERST